MKKKNGRPLKFKTPQELNKLLGRYFKRTKREEWTSSGIALVVGSKQLVQDYDKREEYGEIIKTAKLKVENAYELALRKHGRSGDIFALKNFGWIDKQEVSRPKEENQTQEVISEQLSRIAAVLAKRAVG